MSDRAASQAKGTGGRMQKSGHCQGPAADAGTAPPAEHFLGAVPGEGQTDHQAQNEESETHSIVSLGYPGRAYSPIPSTDRLSETGI